MCLEGRAWREIIGLRLGEKGEGRREKSGSLGIALTEAGRYGLLSPFETDDVFVQRWEVEIWGLCYIW
jgi:hypothetical protein